LNYFNNVVYFNIVWTWIGWIAFYALILPVVTVILFYYQRSLLAGLFIAIIISAFSTIERKKQPKVFEQ